MSPCFATGQAAGTAAALGMKAGGIDLGEIDTDILRKTLKEQKDPGIK